MKNEILEELWQVKNQVAFEHGYDIDKLAKELRKKEKSAKRSIVDFSLPHELAGAKSEQSN